MREQRLAEITARLKETVGTVDEKIGKVVKILADTKDSEDSKMRISQLKTETIGGLKGVIETYDRKRRDVLERMRTDGETGSGTRAEELAAIDKAIEKRAEEILALAKSIPPGEDVEKYENAGSTHFYGYTYDNTRISDEWKQNRRDRVASTKQRHEIQAALEDAIADLEARYDLVATVLKEKELTEAQRGIREAELERVGGLLATRKEQLGSLMLETDEAASATNSDQAADLKALLRDTKQDIAQDFSMALRMFDEVVAEREAVTTAKDNLAARIKWLEEYDAKNK